MVNLWNRIRENRHPRRFLVAMTVLLGVNSLGLMLETVFVRSQAVVASDRTEWTNSLFLSPGIRWSYNFKNGLQIVPGIGVPLGVDPARVKRLSSFI